jgi:hypothetical protein
MSKMMLSESIGLGGATSMETNLATALAMVPHFVVKRLRTEICGKFIYVQVDCPEDKQLRAIERKSGKLVHYIISPEGGKLDVC